MYIGTQKIKILHHVNELINRIIMFINQKIFDLLSIYTIHITHYNYLACKKQLILTR